MSWPNCCNTFKILCTRGITWITLRFDFPRCSINNSEDFFLNLNSPENLSFHNQSGIQAPQHNIHVIPWPIHSRSMHSMSAGLPEAVGGGVPTCNVKVCVKLNEHLPLMACETSENYCFQSHRHIGNPKILGFLLLGLGSPALLTTLVIGEVHQNLRAMYD